MAHSALPFNAPTTFFRNMVRPSVMDPFYSHVSLVLALWSTIDFKSSLYTSTFELDTQFLVEDSLLPQPLISMSGAA